MAAGGRKRVWRCTRSGRRAIDRGEEDPSVAVGRGQGFFLRQEAPDHRITCRRNGLKGASGNNSHHRPRELQRQQLRPPHLKERPTLPERPTTSGDKGRCPTL